MIKFTHNNKQSLNWPVVAVVEVFQRAVVFPGQGLLAAALADHCVHILVLVEAVVTAEPLAEATHALLPHELLGALLRAHACYQVLEFVLVCAVLAAESLAGQLPTVCYRLQLKALPTRFFRPHVLPIVLVFVCICARTYTACRLLSYFA